MRQTINGADFRRLMISAAASIEINKQKLNELNVFPVPDGDTGTNMAMTIGAAAADLRKTEDPTLEKAAATAASAMLRGARGNSGVILSLLLRGISRKLKGATVCDGVLWANALQEGVDAAYKAVMKPAEGTILTVARLAAGKAMDAAQENNYFEYVHAAAIEDAYWVEIDYEQLLTWNPEYIILASDASYTVEDVLGDPVLADCAAVVNGRVYQMPNKAEAWDSPVPSGILGALWLANVLHADLMTDADCTVKMDEYYETFYNFTYSEN